MKFASPALPKLRTLLCFAFTQLYLLSSRLLWLLLKQILDNFDRINEHVA